MSEMVERVAEAIIAELAQLAREDQNVALGKNSHRVARAAIEAMREPTAEMMMCLYVDDYPSDWERGKLMQRDQGSGIVPFESGSECIAGQYQRMIDAALSKVEPHS